MPKLPTGGAAGEDEMYCKNPDSLNRQRQSYEGKLTWITFLTSVYFIHKNKSVNQSNAVDDQ
jgi:hypothetical protein